MAGILEAFKYQGNEVWDDGFERPSQFQMHVDTDANKIGIFSNDLDAKGRPVFQWELWRDFGKIYRTRRAKDGSEVHVTEKDFDAKADTATTEKTAVKQLNSQEGVDVTGEYNLDQEFDLEQQRDLAFKICQFMIGLIIVTFGLLCLFFKMTREQEEQEAARKATPQKSNYDACLNDMSRRATGDSKNPYKKNRGAAVHRQDHSGFGGNSLEHLANEERGRFDNFDVEGAKNYSLLGTFSKA